MIFTKEKEEHTGQILSNTFFVFLFKSKPLVNDTCQRNSGIIIFIHHKPISMKTIPCIFLCFMFIQLGFSQNHLQVLVVAGGHKFDTTAFLSIFKHFDGVTFDTAMQPGANNKIAKGNIKKYDVFLFYDSWKEITPEEKKGYLKLLKAGKGMVFMHHALVSYQNWPEFKEIIGGKYQKARFKGDTINLSDFKHDIWLKVKCNPVHPITKGIPTFDIFDEGYMNIEVSKNVIPLLSTENKYCDQIIGWANRKGKSRIVYLMPGHAQPAFENKHYLQIVEKAIYWTAKRKRNK
jgi:uncharacterized protein